MDARELRLAEAREMRLADVARPGTELFARAVAASERLLPCGCGHKECQFSSLKDARKLAVAYLRAVPAAMHASGELNIDEETLQDALRLQTYEQLMDPISPSLVARHRRETQCAECAAARAKECNAAEECAVAEECPHEEDPCPICYEPYAEGEEVCVFPCSKTKSHKLHYCCMLRAVMETQLDVDGMYECVMCRKPYQVYGWALEKYLGSVFGAAILLSN